VDISALLNSRSEIRLKNVRAADLGVGNPDDRARGQSRTISLSIWRRSSNP
jgi:hypothetical protein